MIAGMTGLMDLVAKVVKHSHPLLYLTVTFYSFIGGGLIANFVSTCGYLQGKASEFEVMTTLECTLVYVLVLSALYSDWCLAVMLHNLVGVPSSDNLVFYWTYFVAKRLTMLSW
jgi:hypothetical protein